MTMKRILILLLTLCLAWSLFACAADRENSGAVKSDSDSAQSNNSTVSTELLQWEVTDEGVKLTNYTGTDKHVVLPDTIDGKMVVSLGTAFAGNVTVESLVLGQHITHLSGSWLKNCDNLKRIEAPSVTEITADLELESLEELCLPALRCLVLDEIEECESLRLLYIPAAAYIRSYKTSNGNLFRWPQSLEEVVIAEGMLARVGGYYEYDEDEFAYIPIGGLTLETKLETDGNEYFDLNLYVALTDENTAAIYCNFFQQETIVVNGKTYTNP